MKNMPKILLITYSLPPTPTGSATVTGNLQMAALADEMAIAGAAPYPRVPRLSTPGRPVIEYISWRTASFRGAGLLRLCQWPLSCLLAWFYMKKHRCDGIMAQYPNTEFLLMGYVLSILTGAKFFPYLHNSFADNVRRGAGAQRWYDILEKRVFKRASAVFVISDGLKQWYLEKYGANCPLVVIRHIFNEKKPSQTSAQAPVVRRYAMVGSVNPSNLSSAKKLIELVLASDADACVALSSGTPVEYLRQHGMLRDRVWQTPRLSRAELMAHLSNVDAVLLPHGHAGKLTEIEYRTIFPTKTIEYLISGRPILALCPDSSFLHAFLEENQCAWILDEANPEDQEARLREFIRNPELRRKLVENALRAAGLFQAEEVIRQWRNAIHSE